MRDKDYYRSLFQDSDEMDEGDIDKMIEFVRRLGDKVEGDDDEDSDMLDAYETMDPEDFLMLALGEKGESDDDDSDDSDEDESPWRFNKDEEYDDAGGEGVDSVGDGEDESEEKEEPDALTVSDEGKKEKGSKTKKDSGCVSDKGMKRVRRKRGPSEEEMTRMNIAHALSDLRF